MTGGALFLISLCVVLETVEQIFFRCGRGGSWGRIFIALGMGLNVIGMAFWLLVLRTVPLGQAMPLLAANNITVALAGAMFFRESISRRRWLGILLISTGVALVSAEFA